MHWKMRNAQLKPGYNVQIGVDSEYIVSKNIFQDRNDVWTLSPFLKTMEEKPGFRYPSVTADSGYGSEGIAPSSNLMILQHPYFYCGTMKTAVVGIGVLTTAVLHRHIRFLKISELSACLKKLHTVFCGIRFVDINLCI